MFGEIIYNNFLFDIPKILDLCVLFGKGNSQLLHKMIGELSNGPFLRCSILPAQMDLEQICFSINDINVLFIFQKTSSPSSRVTMETWMRRFSQSYR